MPIAVHPASSPPPLFLELFNTICILSVLLPSGFLRFSIGALIFLQLLYLVTSIQEASRDAYTLGISCTVLVYRWLDLVVIHHVEEDFWELRHDSNRGCPEGRWKKLQWFFKLWTTQRGVGFNIQPASLPPPPNLSRSKFLRTTLVQTLVMYIRLDIVQNILKHSYASFPSIQFFQFPLITQISLAWSHAFKLHHTISILYFVDSWICVALNIYKPQDWPPMFGKFVSDAYTVRKMWGLCWHQMFRRPCSEAGRIVKELCGFRTGGFMSRYTQLWMGFAVSAAAHQVGAKVGMFADHGFWQAMYFGIQSLGIMFEDGVIAFGRRIRLKEGRLTRGIGFIWVFCWFSWTLRWIVAFYPLSWVEIFGFPSLIDYTSKKYMSK